MTKNIIAVAIIAALSACSSGSDSGDSVDDDDLVMPVTGMPDAGDDGDDGDDGTVSGPVTTPGDGEEPAADTPAGSYIGTIGDAQGTGVFVIDNNNAIAGLSLLADGSAESYFGDLTADTDTSASELRLYAHQESQPEGFQGEFGSVASLENDGLSIEVNVVNGQTVESTAESATEVSLTSTVGSAVTPATLESLAGTWAGSHGFCNTEECFTLDTELTFEGDEVSGFTRFNTFMPDISGLITVFGDAALINFSWNGDSGYSGVVFFSPMADGRLVFVGENPNVEDNPTISGLLTRQ